MNKVILSPIELGELIRELSKAVAQELSKNHQHIPPDDELLSIKEAMEVFGKCRNTIYNWRAEGFLTEHRINGSVYFRKSELLNAGRRKK